MYGARILHDKSGSVSITTALVQFHQSSSFLKLDDFYSNILDPLAKSEMSSDPHNSDVGKGCL